MRDFSSWEEMEAVHKKERAHMLNKSAAKTYRAGLKVAKIPNPLNSRKLTIPAILQTVAEQNCVTSDVIKSRSRRPDICDLRREVFYLARQQGYSFALIGHHVGGRDHSTVREGMQKYEESYL